MVRLIALDIAGTLGIAWRGRRVAVVIDGPKADIGHDVDLTGRMSGGRPVVRHVPSKCSECRAAAERAAAARREAERQAAHAELEQRRAAVLAALPLTRLNGPAMERIAAAVRYMANPEVALAFKPALEAAADELARINGLKAAYEAAYEAATAEAKQRASELYAVYAAAAEFWNRCRTAAEAEVAVLMHPVGECGEYNPHSPAERWYATPDTVRRVKCHLRVVRVAGAPARDGETEDGQPIYKAPTRTYVEEVGELPVTPEVLSWAEDARQKSAEFAALAAQEPTARAEMERAKKEYETAQAAVMAQGTADSVEAARVAYNSAMSAWSDELDKLIIAMRSHGGAR